MVKNILLAADAIKHFLLNMRNYPGLFAVLEEKLRGLPDSICQEIADIVGKPMTDADVDHVFDILARHEEHVQDEQLVGV